MMRCFSLLLIFMVYCVVSMNSSVVIKTKWADLNVTIIHRENTSDVKNFLYTKSAVYGINSPYNAVYGQLVLVLSTDVNPQTNVSYQNSFGCSKYENVNLPAGPFIALVSRGECSFEKKIQVAADSRASGIIVYNDQQETFNMLVRNSTIPNVLTDYSHGMDLINYLKTADVYVGINPGQVEMVENSSLPSRASIYFVAIAFLVVLVVTIIWLSVYYVQKYRFYNAKKRLDNRLKKATQKALSKMPVRKLKSDDTLINETCAICLENYITNDPIRELPCGHYFHQKDVDLWLVEHRTCPMCKVNVLQALGIEINRSNKFLSQYISRMPVSFIGIRPSEQTAGRQATSTSPQPQTELSNAWSRENPLEIDELTSSSRVNVRRDLEAGPNLAENNYKVTFTKNSPSSVNVVEKTSKAKQVTESNTSKSSSRKISNATTSSTAPTDSNNDFTEVPL